MGLLEFLDREVRDSFDEMFDTDRDGVLCPMEQVMQMDFMDETSGEYDDSDDYDDFDGCGDGGDWD